MYYSFSFQGRRPGSCSDSDLGTPSPTLLAFMRNSRGVKKQLTARPKSHVGPSPRREPHTELGANLVQKYDWHFPLSFKTQYINIINKLKVRRFFWLAYTLVSFLFSTLSWKANSTMRRLFSFTCVVLRMPAEEDLQWEHCLPGVGRSHPGQSWEPCTARLGSLPIWSRSPLWPRLRWPLCRSVEMPSRPPSGPLNPRCHRPGMLCSPNPQ